MKRYIVVKTQFEGIHSWPECPYGDVSFLRFPHRHIFHVTVRVSVSDSRDIEFIRFKRKLDSWINSKLILFGSCDAFLGTVSCEDICDKIHEAFPEAVYIQVMEDNENGAELIV